MNLTKKQKLFWIAVLALAVLYFAPSFIRLRPSLPATRPAAVQQPVSQPTPQWGPVANPPKPPIPVPAIDPNAPIDGSFDRLVGAWQGFSAPSGSSFCTMKFELRKKSDAPDKYAGFPELLCMPPSAMTSSIYRGGRFPSGSSMNPMSAILTGSVTNGSLSFSVDKAIGASTEGCSLTSFNATPFGTDQIAADWQSGSCEKPSQGQMMLRRIGR